VSIFQPIVCTGGPMLEWVYTLERASGVGLLRPRPCGKLSRRHPRPGKMTQEALSESRANSCLRGFSGSCQHLGAPSQHPWASDGAESLVHAYVRQRGRFPLRLDSRRRRVSGPHLTGRRLLTWYWNRRFEARRSGHL